MLSYSKMAYVHLDWLVYKDTDILRMLWMAREHVYHGVHMHFEYNLKSLVA